MSAINNNEFLDNLTLTQDNLASEYDNKLIWSLREKRAQRSLEIYEVNLYPLDGARTFLRSGSSDPIVVHETFVSLYHIPPSIVGNISSVLDLGSNIGLTLAHYAVLFPKAKLLGIELDPSTASIGNLNIYNWRDRCRLINGAAWIRDEPVNFGSTAGEEYGNKIGGSGDQLTCDGYSIGSLIDILGVEQVDFVKMDVEGAELRILTENCESWAPRVKSMLIELHGYDPVKLLEDLDKIGFTAWKHKRHWESYFAIRKDLI